MKGRTGKTICGCNSWKISHVVSWTVQMLKGDGVMLRICLSVGSCSSGAVLWGGAKGNKFISAENKQKMVTFGISSMSLGTMRWIFSVWFSWSKLSVIPLKLWDLDWWKIGIRKQKIRDRWYYISVEGSRGCNRRYPERYKGLTETDGTCLRGRETGGLSHCRVS